MKKNIIWKILIYFIIYSIIGFFMETIYGAFTKGMLESRKSFLYGPFCIVYGIASIILILCLKKYKHNNVKLFLYGMILGSGIEYFSSCIGEVLLHVKWWDYSNDFLNINGRTCLYYAVMWGILSIILVKYVNPFLDKCIDLVVKNVSQYLLKLSITTITLFMIFDGALTCYALDNFLVRVANEYNININGIEKREIDDLLGNTFSNEQMIMTYPNIIVTNENNETIHVGSILKDIKNYYYKFEK